MVYRANSQNNPRPARPASRAAPPPRSGRTYGQREGITTPEYLRLAAEYLKERGSSLQDFEQAGGEVVEDASRLGYPYHGPALIYNFKHPLTGETITFIDQQGRIQPFQRAKLLGSRPAGSPKFLQKPDSGTHVYFTQHPGAKWPEVALDTSYGIAITEGETRSDAGAVHGLPVISVTGVNCGQVDSQLHPDFAFIDWRGRQVFLAFDSDVSRNPKARRAILKIAHQLRQCGAGAFEVSLPPAPDGSKLGLDDYLARYGADAFKALLRSPETRLISDPLTEDFTFHSDTDIENEPDPVYLVDKLLQEDTTACIYGQPGSYKTFNMLEIAASLSLGLKPYGYMMLGKMGSRTVIYALGEGGGSFKKRLKAWKLHHKVSSLPDLHIVKRVPFAAQDEDMSCFIEKAREFNPDMVILDTYARFSAGLDINAPMGAQIAFQGIDRIRRELGCTVVVIHHSGKDTNRGEMGSLLLRANLDTSIEVITGETQYSATLKVRKQRDDELLEVPVQGHRVVLDPTNVESQTSLVFELGTPSAPEDGTGKYRATIIVSVLHKMATSGKNEVTPKQLAPELLKIWGEWPKTPAEQEAKKDNVARVLSREAKTTLKSYVVRVGGLVSKPLKFALRGHNGGSGDGQ